MSFADRLPGAFRLLRRHTGFAAHAVLILALGIGATSAVFSLFHGALLTPPPYAEPERLVLISLQRLLFGVGPADPATLAAAALAFVVVALLACCLPAARAARVQPAEALKSE